MAIRDRRGVLRRVDRQERRNEQPWRGNHHRGRQQRVGERDAESSLAGAGDCALVMRAIGATDPDRHGLTKPQRDHEGEARDLQRDRMRHEGGRSKSPIARLAAEKDPDLRHDHQADRQAEPPQRREFAKGRPPGQGEQP